MKKTITIFFLLMITGCGSEKFMGWLSTTGDAFTESVELGKKAKAIMFECNFDKFCSYERIYELVTKECKTPEKFDMVNALECEKVFEIQLTQAYWQNRQIMGYPPEEPLSEREIEEIRDKIKRKIYL